MGYKTLVAVLMTTSLMATIAFGPALMVSLQGDVNGDGKIDVLDAQLLVAKVVKGKAIPNAAQADANRDGRLNVLDLQYTLARVNGAPVEEAPVPAEKKSPSGTLNSVLLLLFSLCAVFSGLLSLLARPHAPKRFPRLFPAFSLHTQRYLLILTPHAPPALS